MEQLVNRRRVLYPKSEKEIDYSKLYFTTVALENGSITFTIPSQLPTSTLQSISYSRDGGTTWINTNNVDNQLVKIIVDNLIKDDSILWKGNGIATCINNGSDDIYSNILSDRRFNVEGNIMSLLYGDDFYDKIKFPNGSTYTFSNLFSDCRSVINANNLVLPATTLVDYCYSHMFFYCSKLVTTPELPAATLALGCYKAMFDRCLLLTTAPELPATTLASYCYQYMFRSCSSLTTAPVLPATTLINNCYEGMFISCSSLVTAPELPAITLALSCYGNMFYNCRRLNYIKAMFTTFPSNSYTSNWVNSISSSGTFVKNSAATWNVTGNNAIPSGWTVQTASE